MKRRLKSAVLARHQQLLKQASPHSLAELAAMPIAEFEWPLVMTPEHPLARLLGFRRAKALADLPCNKRSARAAHRRREIERLSLAGREVETIACELELSAGYVVQVRSALGLGNVNQKRMATATIDAIMQLNAEGYSDGQIAAVIGRDRGYVCNLRKRHGIAPVPADKRRR